jgi:hypothetical protein
VNFWAFSSYPSWHFSSAAAGGETENVMANVASALQKMMKAILIETAWNFGLIGGRLIFLIGIAIRAGRSRAVHFRIHTPQLGAMRPPDAGSPNCKETTLTGGQTTLRGACAASQRA